MISGSGRGRRLLALLIAVIIAGAAVCMPHSFLISTRTAMTVHAASASAEELKPDVDTVIQSVRSYMLSVDKEPNESSLWNLLDMARSGLTVPASYASTCYKNTLAFLEENDWQITRAKYTEYSKLILGLTSIGVDASNLNGHNMLAYLSDMKNITKQGFNGPIWALIALNSHPSYEIPKDDSAQEQVTEEGLITYLLDGQLEDGGWTMFGSVGDSDITGMTIQALSPYYGKRDDVTKAIDKGLDWLSKNQMDDGGFGTLSGEDVIPTSESVAQVVTALSMVGIDCQTDKRFIKNGKSPLHALFSYYLEEGGFMHVKAGGENNGGGEAGTIDGLATEQGMYASVAYARLMNGRTALYDNSDISLTVCDEVYKGSGDFLGKDEPADTSGDSEHGDQPDQTSDGTDSAATEAQVSTESASASDQAETAADGWSFSGDDYVPETNAAETPAETNNLSQNPLVYIAAALVLAALIAAAIIIYKKNHPQNPDQIGYDEDSENSEEKAKR